jgi:hypothetical protein
MLVLFSCTNSLEEVKEIVADLKELPAKETFNGVTYLRSAKRQPDQPTYHLLLSSNLKSGDARIS